MAADEHDSSDDRPVSIAQLRSKFERLSNNGDAGPSRLTNASTSSTKLRVTEKTVCDDVAPADEEIAH